MIGRICRCRRHIGNDVIPVHGSQLNDVLRSDIRSGDGAQGNDVQITVDGCRQLEHDIIALKNLEIPICGATAGQGGIEHINGSVHLQTVGGESVQAHAVDVTDD